MNFFIYSLTYFLKRLIFFIILVTVLTSCGQKGALYLPQPAQPTSPPDAVPVNPPTDANIK